MPVRLAVALALLAASLSTMAAASQFQAPQYYNLPGSGAGAYGTVTADFNQDGWPDIATLTLDPQNGYILLNRGDGTFDRGFSLKLSSGTVSMATGDLNDDGFPDLVLTNRTQGTIF